MEVCFVCVRVDSAINAEDIQKIVFQHDSFALKDTQYSLNTNNCNFYECHSPSSVSPFLYVLLLDSPQMTFIQQLRFSVTPSWHFCTVNQNHFFRCSRANDVWVTCEKKNEAERKLKKESAHICTYCHLYLSWKHVINLPVRVTVCVFCHHHTL